MTKEKEWLDYLATLDAIEAVQPTLRPQKTNKPQNAAFECKSDIILFGGSAFGGKSITGLLFSLYKSQDSVIFRRELPMHNGLIRNIKRFFPKRLKGNPPVFFPTDEDRRRGVICNQIRLAYLNHENDLDGEQGNNKTTAVFDEAVQFPWEWINRVSAHIRSNDPEGMARLGIMCHLILTFNPPLTAVGLWILDILAPWIDPNHPLYPVEFGEVIYMCYRGDRFFFFRDNTPLDKDPATGEHQEDPILLKSITYFRAKAQDNENFDDAYKATLQNLSEVERRAFLDGEMTASLVDEAGQIVRRKNWLQAESRWMTTEKPTTPPIVVSIDIAEGGDDNFVCMPFWKFGYAGMPHSTQGKNVPKISDQVKFVESYIMDILHSPIDGVSLIVDVGGGYGGGFCEQWEEKHPNSQVVRFNGGDAPGINDIFGGGGDNPEPGEISGMPLMSGNIGFNHKSHAAWVRAGQMLEHPLFSIAVPPHSKLAREAQSRLIKERSSAKIVIESKDEIRKKLGHSPDYADAWVMGLWYLSVELAVREKWA